MYLESVLTNKSNHCYEKHLYHSEELTTARESLYVCRYHLPILLLAFAIEAQEITANANTLASAFAMHNKIFVSDPSVPRLLPASMKL